MYSKHFSTLVFLQSILIFLLLATACTAQAVTLTADIGSISTPNPDHTAIVSISETPPIPYFTPTVAVPADLLTSLQIIVTAIETNQPKMLNSLIGDEGVAAGGFAQEMNFNGFNNSEGIVEAFTAALNESEPICVGFAPFIGALPDKAVVVYRGINFDWSRFGFSPSNRGNSMTLQLFKLADGWRLVYITPLNPERDLLPILGPLQDCPAPS
jgi:hypothetical protein